MLGGRGAEPLAPGQAHRHQAEVPAGDVQLHRQKPRRPQDGKPGRGARRVGGYNK